METGEVMALLACLRVALDPDPQPPSREERRSHLETALSIIEGADPGLAATARRAFAGLPPSEAGDPVAEAAGWLIQAVLLPEELEVAFDPAFVPGPDPGPELPFGEGGAA